MQIGDSFSGDKQTTLRRSGCDACVPGIVEALSHVEGSGVLTQKYNFRQQMVHSEAYLNFKLSLI